tara:strand:- start:412 stop:777 length:366 start_codon:yes stop_codon:yes gene_type:complete
MAEYFWFFVMSGYVGVTTTWVGVTLMLQTLDDGINLDDELDDDITSPYAPKKEYKKVPWLPNVLWSVLLLAEPFAVAALIAHYTPEHVYLRDALLVGVYFPAIASTLMIRAFTYIRFHKLL